MKDKMNKIITTMLTFSALLAILILPAAAETVSVIPATVTLTPGGTATVQIQATGITTNISAATFTLTYNTSVVNATTVSPGDFVSSNPVTDIVIFAPNINRTIGTVSIGVAKTLGITTPVVTLSTVTFAAVGAPGTTTTLTLAVSALADAAGTPRVPATIVNGVANIAAGPVPGTITGTVINASSNATIAGATVTAGAVTAITNAAGVYTISIAAGTYTVTASAANFTSGSALVTVAAGATVTQNFALTPGGALLPRIWNETQNGVTPPSPYTWNVYNFEGFFYDLKDDLGKEQLILSEPVLRGDVGNNPQRVIAKSNLQYSTEGQPKTLKVAEALNLTGDNTGLSNKGLEQAAASKGFENGQYWILGWQAERYVALNGKVDKLSKLILEHGTSASDKRTLTVGETWDIGDGWTLTANSIDAKATPRQVWLTLSKDGVKRDDKVISAGTTDAKPIYTYVEKSLAGETDVPVFVTFVDSVFAGATTDMVQLRYTWLISETVTKISSSDTYGVFKDANVQGKKISLGNTDTTVTLTRDSTQDLMGTLKFQVADSPVLRFMPVAPRTQPGTYETRGAIWNENQVAGTIGGTGRTAAWDPKNFAGFFYDLKDDLGTEQLMVLQTDLKGDVGNTPQRVINKGNLKYSTTAQAKTLKVSEALNLSGDNTGLANKGLEQAAASKGFDAGQYWILGWQADRYVALNGKVDKLSKLIVEHGTSAADKRTLTVGETWDVGEGWTLTANSIDAKATPRQVWLTLSKDGVKKDDKVISAGTTDAKPIYTFVEKSLAGETDVPVFVTFVDSVFAGATTDMVQLRYTWLISETVTKVSSSDTYGVFKDANVAGKSISLGNTDTTLTLTRDSTQDLMGKMKFRVADSASLRFYPMVEYTIGPGGTTGTGTPGPGTATVTVTGARTGTLTSPPPPPPTTTTAPPTTAPPTPTPTKVPGFEAVFAVAGLLAVAFLVLRQRK